MVQVNPKPADNTNFQLLAALVPDIEERLEAMRKEHPDFFRELHRRVVETEEGWRPLHCWQGAF